MPLARKCIRCGHTFLAKKDEQYCKQCAKDELMAILNKDKPPTPAKDEAPKKEVKEKGMTKCKNCGKMFEQTGKGRPAVNCPTCRDLLNKPNKKSTDIKDKVITVKKKDVVAPVISKKETAESYINVDSVSDLYPVNEIKDRDNMIYHPSHYNKGKIEVIDFIEDQGLSFHLGNVIKYVARAGAKGDKLEDLKKARWYLDRYINEVMK
jgi:DNA-directed RNA polymerase subunit RPC12/RpoP|nr:MAG TPA: nucelotide kinase [Caudoviricetes sp.]